MSKHRRALGGLFLGVVVLLATTASWAGVVVLGPSSTLLNGTIEVPLVVEGTGLVADALTISQLTFDETLVTLSGMTPSPSYADNLLAGGLPSVPLFLFVAATEDLLPGPILTWSFTPKGPPIPATSLVSVNVLVESQLTDEFTPSTPLSPVPEPEPVLMLLAGLALLGILKIRRGLN